MVTWRSCIASSSALCTFAGRPVDLVGQDQVGENRPERDLELAELLVVDPGADDVCRHQVGRELDALELDAQRVGEGLDRQRLREPGYPLDQQVAPGHEGDDHPLKEFVLADDDPLYVVQDLLERHPGRSAGPPMEVLICRVRLRLGRRCRSVRRTRCLRSHRSRLGWRVRSRSRSPVLLRLVGGRPSCPG